MGQLLRGTLLFIGTRTSSDVGTALNLGAIEDGQSLWGVLHVQAASASDTLDVVIESDSSEAFSTPTTRLTFSQQSARGSNVPAHVAGPVTDTWWRAKATLAGTDPSFTFTVSMGKSQVESVVGLGGDGVNIILIGASYLSGQGLAGVPNNKEVRHLIMQALPDDAFHTFHDLAFPSRSLAVVLANLDAEVAPLLSADRPNFIFGHGGSELNSHYYEGDSSAQILTDAAAIKAWCVARPETIRLAVHNCWPFGTDFAAWEPKMDAVNLAYTNSLATYADRFVDLRTVVPTIMDEDGMGEPLDHTLLQYAGSHPNCTLARVMSDQALLAMKAEYTGADVTFPNGYRITNEDPANPTTLVVKDGRISGRWKFIATRTGVDDTRYEPCIGDAEVDWFPSITSYAYAPLTYPGMAHWAPDSNTIPAPNEFRLYAAPTATKTFYVFNGLTIYQELIATFAAGYDLAKPWLMNMVRLVRGDPDNEAATWVDKEAGLVLLADPALNLIASGANFTSLDDARTGYAAPQLTVLGGSPDVSSTEVDGWPVTQIDLLGATDEIAFAYDSRLHLEDGLSRAITMRIAANFADGAGGLIRLESADDYLECVGGTTNIQGGSSIQDLATDDLASPVVPRVSPAGNSWRIVMMRIRSGGTPWGIGAEVEISGLGYRANAPAPDAAFVDADFRLRFKGPNLRIRYISIANFPYTATVDSGSDQVISQFKMLRERYGCSTVT